MTTSAPSYSSIISSAMENIESVFEKIENGLLILTPNHRTSVQLLESYGAYRKQNNYSAVCRSPQIFPVDIWVRDQWEDLLNQGKSNVEPTIILEPFQELFLWKAIIRDSSIGSGLLSLEGTANTVQEAYRSIQQWQIPINEIEDFTNSPFNDAVPYEDIDVFLTWLDEYKKRSSSNKFINLSQLLEQFISALEEDLIALPDEIMLLGFDNPPPLYRTLFTTLDKSINKVSLFKLKNFQPNLEKRALNSQEQEMISAAQWAKRTLENNPTAKIAVICPDLHGRHQELQRAFSNSFYPNNIFAQEIVQNTLFSSTASEKLSAIPLIASALMLLELNQISLPTLEVCQLLRSPYIIDAELESQARAALEYRLRKNTETTIRLSQLRYLCAQTEKPWHCPALSNALLNIETLRQQHKAKLPLKEWVNIIEQQLSIMGWSIPEDEKPVQQLWQNLLKNLIRLGSLSAPLNFLEAIGILRQLANTSNAALFFNQAPVQILSPVEAAGLQFSHLWFMGLSELNWPPNTRSNPFIPLKIQKRHKLPASSAELQYLAAKESLQQFLNNTSTEVVLSYPQQADDISVKPSMLLADFNAETIQHEIAEQTSGLHPYTQVLFNSKISLDTFQDDLNIPLQAEEIASGGTALIADQATCAFSSFAKHRLKATELPKLQYGLPAFAVGNMLHHAMEILWKELKSQSNLIELKQETISQLVSKAATEAVTKISNQYPATMNQRYRELETERLGELLIAWLEEERKRGSFDIVEHEYSLQWQYSNLSLEFRIDRIEKLPDDTYGLVDYKTSKNNNNVNWFEDRQDKPQLMLYLQAAENDPKFHDITSLLYAQVNIEEMKYRGISQSADIYPGVALEKQRNRPADISWQALKDHWKISLEGLAQEFLDGYVAINPKSPSSCQYCHLGALCRIQEKRKQL